jgi:hypothetical protein
VRQEPQHLLGERGVAVGQAGHFRRLQLRRQIGHRREDRIEALPALRVEGRRHAEGSRIQRNPPGGFLTS